MTTVINNPGEGSGGGWIVGILILIILLVVFFVYGLPALRGNNGDDNGVNVKVELPSGTTNPGTGGTNQ